MPVEDHAAALQDREAELLKRVEELKREAMERFVASDNRFEELGKERDEAKRLFETELRGHAIACRQVEEFRRHTTSNAVFDAICDNADLRLRANRAEAALREARQMAEKLRRDDAHLATNTASAHRAHEEHAGAEFQMGRANGLVDAARQLTDLLPALDTSIGDREPPGCLSCGNDVDEQVCPKSKRACRHHCNCSWVNDHCHWCGQEFGEEPPAPCSDQRCRKCGGTGREPAPISRGSYACSVCGGSGVEPPAPVPSGASGNWPEAIWRIQIYRLLSPKALHTDSEREARGWVETGANVRKYVPAESEGADLQPLLQAAQRVCDVKGTSIPVEEVEALGAALARFGGSAESEGER